MNLKTIDLQERATVRGYEICVHEMKDVTVYAWGQAEPKNVRSVRVLVEYVNRSEDTLKFRLNQWLLFDSEGFTYDFEIRTQFYEDDNLRKLQEGIIAPGQRVRGWVAFQLPPDAQPAHVQFRPDALSRHALNIRLGKSD